jgi:hypothetical protein
MAAVPASALAHLERVMAKARAQPARLLLLSLVLVARSRCALSRCASSLGFQASADEAARVAALERTAATCTALAGAPAQQRRVRRGPLRSAIRTSSHAHASLLATAARCRARVHAAGAHHAPHHGAHARARRVQALRLRLIRAHAGSRTLNERSRRATSDSACARSSRRPQVPFGGAAFFEGSLVHTNELTCHLGADVYAERTAAQAAELLLRRAADASAQAATAQAALGALAQRQSVLGGVSEDASGFFEIREDYDEAAAAESSSLSSSSHDAAAASPQAALAARRAARAAAARRAPAEEEEDAALMARHACCISACMRALTFSLLHVRCAAGAPGGAGAG